MINHVIHSLSGSFAPHTSEDRSCPVCAASYLYRTKRRTIDRLLSRLVPVRRYHCERCGWVGNLKVNHK